MSPMRNFRQGGYTGLQIEAEAELLLLELFAIAIYPEITAVGGTGRPAEQEHFIQLMCMK